MHSQENTEEYDTFVILLQVFVMVSSCFEGWNAVDWNGGADINVCSMDMFVAGTGSSNERKCPDFPLFAKSRPQWPIEYHYRILLHTNLHVDSISLHSYMENFQQGNLAELQE